MGVGWDDGVGWDGMAIVSTRVRNRTGCRERVATGIADWDGPLAWERVGAPRVVEGRGMETRTGTLVGLADWHGDVGLVAPSRIRVSAVNSTARG